MNEAFSRLIRVVHIYYDKFMALGVCLMLLVSLVILLVRVGTDKAEHERFTRGIEALAPEHPQPAPLDLEIFENAYRELSEPYRMSAWKRPVTAPETRVHCVNCERPIPYAAAECPYCAHKQPDDPAPPEVNLWVEEHGVDPYDRAIASRDLDGDGFTVLEEYIFGTNPHDPQSFPPPWVKLRVDVIASETLEMLFMGRSRTGARTIFQLNMHADGRTHWAEIGDEIEGFTIAGYEEKIEQDGYRRLDVSILTLQREDMEINLTRGETTPHLQYRARLFFEIDNSRHEVVRGSALTLMEQTYQVLEIDAEERRLQLQDENGNALWIGTASISSREVEEF